MTTMRGPSLLLSAALALMGCGERGAAPGSGSSTEISADTKPAVVDICKTMGEDDPVCVLLADGHVACARVQAETFEPPLAGIDEAVEIACGAHGVCVLETSGELTCLDKQGKLRELEALEGARSLAPDCAVTKTGALACWDENWEVETRSLPRLAAALGSKDSENLDLLRVGQTSAYNSEDACALHSNGELWCWGWTANGNEPKPSKVHTFANAQEVRQLEAEGPNICWRELGRWRCTDGKSEPRASRTCDHTPCACELDGNWCMPLDTEGESGKPKQLDEAVVVEDVVLRTYDCVVDSSWRVWCKRWPALPPTIKPLVFEGETTELAAFEGVAPTPEPSPLPDPAVAACPANAKLGNRLCGVLRQPEAALACRPGARTCPCTVSFYWFDDESCAPAGFDLVESRGLGTSSADIHSFIVHAEGERAALGPRVTIEPNVREQVGAVTVFELADERDEGDSFFYWQSELDAVILCALVDGAPACSAPLVRAWDYFESSEADEYDEGHTRSERYRAKLKIGAASVKVTVKANKGKPSTGELPGLADLRFLKAGTYRLAELLDRPFVDAPD